MGVRTLEGTADGTSAAAAMYDSVTGTMLGLIFEGDDAVDQVDAFQEWMRQLKFISTSEAIGLLPSDVPRPEHNNVGDPRTWPHAGLCKLINYWRRTVVASTEKESA